MSSMSPMTTSLAAANTGEAKAAHSASASADRVRCFMACLLGTGWWNVKGSDAQVLVQHVHLAGEFRLGELLDDAAVLHDVEAVGQRRGEAEVLLHQHDGVALGLERADHLAELLHDDRRQAFGDLVQQ